MSETLNHHQRGAVANPGLSKSVPMSSRHSWIQATSASECSVSELARVFTVS